jgi:transcriptional regulator with XRE-family HTH domain
MRESHRIIAARVGARLKALRGNRTQAEYAASLGLSQAQYNRYETGKRLAPDAVLTRAAQMAGITPEELLWGSLPAAEGTPDYARAVAELAALLDAESQEDLYYFLKHKVDDLARRRRRGVRRARAALESLRRKVG